MVADLFLIAVTFFFLLPLAEVVRLVLALLFRVPVIGFNLGLGPVGQTLWLKNIPIHFRRVPLMWHCRLPLAHDDTGSIIPDLEITGCSPEEEKRLEEIGNAYRSPLPKRFFLPLLLSPLATFLIGVLLATAGFRYTTTLRAYSEEPIIASVREESPEWQAGIKAGDRILSIGETRVEKFDDVIRAFHRHLGSDKPVLVTILREDSSESQAFSIMIPAPTTPKMNLGTKRIGRTPTWSEALHLAHHTIKAVIQSLVTG
jgi:regulator of sigma E protease